MKYFFNLGANPALSIAELSAVFGMEKISAEKEVKPPAGRLVSNNIFLLDIKEKINAQELIKKIGGTIKIGEIKSSIEHNLEKIKQEIIKIIDEKEKDGKLKFGFSYYGNKKFNFLKMGLEIKKYLKEKNINSRLVTSKEKVLSSVVVEQNKLVAKGLEIVLIEDDNQILIGKTLAVQPFKELSFRDYGRPGRDDLSGMLPPKLAQIMINLSRPNTEISQAFLLDPFCGSGTILTEAMLMGYKKLIGSDISGKAIEDTQKNINWLKIKFPISDFQLQLYKLSAVEISKKIKLNSIDAIATEPYLGPPRGKIDFKDITQELNSLYTKTIKEFQKILKPGAKVVMAWPIFNNGRLFLNPDINKFKIIIPLPKNLASNKNLNLTQRNTIIYGRSGQKVWREIVILQKIKNA